jgi:hypothetical protein
MIVREIIRAGILTAGVDKHQGLPRSHKLRYGGVSIAIEANAPGFFRTLEVCP